MEKETIKIAAYISGGLVAGGLLGVFLSRDHYKTKYRALAEDEIESVKDVFRRQAKDGEYTSPASTLEALHGETVIVTQSESPLLLRQTEIIREQGYVMVEGERYDGGGEPNDNEDEGESNEQQIRNIFDPNGLPARVPGRPYVITVEEYMTDDSYEKISLAYYDGDNTLADERDKIIPEITKVIGDATDHFGVGSNDPVIVYVKNEAMGTMFEVVKDEQSYQELILKIRDTEDRPIRRKLRDDE